MKFKTRKAQNEAAVSESEKAEIKVILPDEEYAAQVAKEDPEALEKARRKLMALIGVKAKGMGGDTLATQIRPMVYSMSLSDCENMYKVLSEHGIFGLLHIVAKNNKKQEKGK